MQLACRRHLADLKRSRAAEFRYRWDAASADRACKFISALPHTKGKWADGGELIRLELFQKFLVRSLFGWISKNDGSYRFRTGYWEMPRKNAKSTLAAAIGLYKFAADREFGAEVYSGATTKKQAWEVFRPARLMAERTPSLCRAFGIKVNAESLTIAKNGSRFEPLIGKPGDGASPSCAIVDEYHEHADDSLVDAMKTGMGARERPLMLVITTAGSDRSGPCYALHLDVCKLLEGKLVNDRLFGVIYTIDEGDDWQSPTVLAKANPNYGVSVFHDYLQEEQQDAINSASKQNAFKTKHENVWVNADVAWMNMAAWDRGADPHLRIEEFAGESCTLGLDFASRIDIAAKIRLFRKVIDGKQHFYCFGTYYINEEAVRQSRGHHYASWANQGRLVVTPGNVTDFVWIGDDLLKDVKQFRVREIAYDPYQSDVLLQFLAERPEWPKNSTSMKELLDNPSLPRVALPVEIAQNVRNLSAPMKELEAIVLDGRLHHDGDPVLGWMISNVVCHRDAKDNIYPRKEREENKIDGVISLIMALLRMLATPVDSGLYRKSVFDRGSFWS